MSDNTVVLASNNAGKAKELNRLLAPLGFNIVSQKDYSVSEVAETGLTFVENAIIKARHAAEQTGLPAIADDSGLEVDALNGAPGIYSARFAGEGASDEDNVEKLLADLQGQSNRGARFQCCLVFMRHGADPVPVIAQGAWEGEITQQTHGENGFGYDPVFFVPAEGCTAAELSPEQKNNQSHRAIASAKLLELLSVDS